MKRALAIAAVLATVTTARLWPARAATDGPPSGGWLALGTRVMEAAGTPTGAAVAASSGSHATSGSDSLGDTRNVSGSQTAEPRGDISGFGLEASADTLTLTVTVPGGTDPT